MGTKPDPTQVEAARLWKRYAPKHLRGLVRTDISTDEATAEFMYNPQETRDWHGRWVQGAGAYVNGKRVNTPLPDEEDTAMPLQASPLGVEGEAKQEGLTFKDRPVEPSGSLAAPPKPVPAPTAPQKAVSHVRGRPTPDYTNPEIVGIVRARNAQMHPTKEFADAHGMTEAEYAKAAQAHLEGLVSKARLATRRSMGTVGKILDSGRLKTPFDSGVLGMNDKAEYAMSEQIAWGYPKRMKDNELRPIFGYLTDDPDTEIADGSHIEDYGDTTIVLKDAVRQRATFSFHDSMGGLASEQAMGLYVAATVPVSNPTLESYRQDELDMLELPHIQDAEQHVQSQAFAYAEAQYHEGVKLDDIDYFVFPKEPDAHLKAQLAGKGFYGRYKVVKPRPTRTPEQVRAAMDAEAHAAFSKNDWYSEWAVLRSLPTPPRAVAIIEVDFYG